MPTNGAGPTTSHESLDRAVDDLLAAIRGWDRWEYREEAYRMEDELHPLYCKLLEEATSLGLEAPPYPNCSRYSVIDHWKHDWGGHFEKWLARARGTLKYREATRGLPPEPVADAPPDRQSQ